MKNKRNDTEMVSKKMKNPVKEDKAILYEDKTKRTRNSKTFVRNDGTAKKIISAVPLHYMNKEENKFREIDNRMKDKGDFFETSYGNVKAKINKDVSKGAKVSVSEGEFALDWEYQPKTDSAATLSVEDCEGLAIGAKAVCRDIDEATDIEYGFVGESVKENIIIKEKCDEYEYTFKINSHGLTAKLSEDKKEIGFYADESTEDVKFKIPAPFMFDAKGDTSTDVHYVLEEIGESEYTFKVIAAADWINRDATALPVIIDPQIICGTLRDYDIISHYSDRRLSDGDYEPYNMNGFMYVGVMDSYIYRTTLNIDTSQLLNVKHAESIKLYVAAVTHSAGSKFHVDGGTEYFYPGEDTYVGIDIYNLTQPTTTIVLGGEQRSAYGEFYGTVDAQFAPYIEVKYVESEIPKVREKMPSIPELNVTFNVKDGDSSSTFCVINPQDSVKGIGIYNTYKVGSGDSGFGKDMIFSLNETLKKVASDNNQDTYEHIDGEGNAHLFYDFYYYYANENTKVFVSKNEVTMDENGDFSYNTGTGVYEVYRCFKNLEGDAIISMPENLKNSKDHETRSEERIKIEEEIKSCEKAIEYNHYGLLSPEGNFMPLESLTGFNVQEAVEHADKANLWIATRDEANNYYSTLMQVKVLENQKDSISTQQEMIADQINSLEIQKTGNNIQIRTCEDRLERIYNAIECIEEDEDITDPYFVGWDINMLLTELNTTQEQLGYLNALNYCANQNKENSNYQKADNNVIYETADDQIYALNKHLRFQKKSDVNRDMLLSYNEKIINLKKQLPNLNMNEPVMFIKSNGCTKGFDETGNLVAIYDKNGNAAGIEFNSEGRIRRLYDEDGHQVVFHYTPGGKINYITDINGTSTKYSYESGGLLGSVIYKDGKTLSFRWEDGKVLLAENSDNQRVVFTYTEGKLTKTALQTKETRTAFGEVEISEEFSDLLSAEITSSSNYDGNPMTVVSDSEGISKYYVFDTDGYNIEYYLEEHGVVTEAKKFEYVASHKVRTITSTSEYLGERDYYTFPFMYDSDDVKIDLDAFERPSRKFSKYTLDGGITVSETASYTYDDNDNCIKEETHIVVSGRENPFDTVTKHFYNEKGIKFRTESYVVGEETKSGVNVSEYYYDDKGNQTKSCSYNSLDTSSKRWSENEYEDNRVIAQLDSLGKHKTILRYTDNSNEASEYVYPNGASLAYGKELDGTVSAVTSSDESDEANSNAKHFTNNLMTRVISGNNEVKYEYDRKGRIKKVSLNGDEDYVAYEYTDDTSLDGKTVDKVVATNAKGEKFTSYTDKFGNVLRTDYGNSIQMLATYNSDNSISTVTDRWSGPSLSYNYSDHRLTSFVSNGGRPFEEAFEYTGTNLTRRNISPKYGSGNLDYRYSYDENLYNSPLTSVTLNDTIIIEPTYDALGRTTAKEIEINGTAVLGEYYYFRKHGDRTSDMISTIRYGSVKNGKFSIGDGIKYHYDCMGNIDRIYENGMLTASYSYDFLGRIIREDNKPLNFTRVFAYDNNGNILSTRKCEYSLKDFDELIFTEENEYLYDTKSDKLLGYNDETFEYDEIGNPTTYRGKTVTWSHGRQMMSFGENMSFEYDGKGNRIFKITHYDDGTTLANDYTYDSDGNLIFDCLGFEFFYFGSSVAGFIYNGSYYIYKKDALGNITELLDSSGNTVAKYVYDAWGNHVVLDANGNEITDSTHIGNLNPFRYRGYYFDTETGLYFLQSRYYDPVTGRFVTIDDHTYLDPDTVNGVNLYAYCLNNPVMNVDPNGCASWWNWLISGLQLIGGVALCFVPGAQGFGVSLMVSGGSMLASNILSIAGVDGKTASIISSGLDIIAGIALCFTPFAGVGASMIGAGTLGIAGGYISESLGYGFEAGAMIGSILGGFIGSKVFDGIQIAKIARNGNVVLGEGMDRVISKANEIGAVRYHGMPGFKSFSKVLPKTAMNQLGLAHNARWIRWVGKAGANIVDIGIVVGKNSPNYMMEILYIGRWLF